MSFVLNEEQQMLKDAATAYVADALPITHLRKLRDEGRNGHDPESWKAMAEMGWAGILVPEAQGGSDFGFTGLGQILEAQGATLAATPMLQTALIGASALVLGGSTRQQDVYLPKIAAGDITLALACDEGPHHSPAVVRTSATKEGDSFHLAGKKTFVANGHFADMLIVSARTGGAPGDASGISLFLVPANSDGVDVTALNTIDSHGAANVSFDGVVVPSANLLGTEGNGGELLEAILDRARIGLAAEMLGAADAAFRMTHDYLQTRKQFGRLIGSFQSLQHRAATMFSELELTRSCVAAALSALDANRNDIREMASLAKARAAETLHLVTNEMIQMHGGIGMTDAHDAGFFIKRARVAEALYGGESFHRDRYASLNGF